MQRVQEAMQQAYGTGQMKGEAEAMTSLKEVESLAELLYLQGTQEVQLCQVYQSDLSRMASELHEHTDRHNSTTADVLC